MRNKGFTVIEVVVVMAIVAILSSIAIPGFSRWIPDYQLKNAARDLYSNLQLAKMTAVKENGVCRVEFDSSVSPGTYLIRSAANDVIRTVDLGTYGRGMDFGTVAPPASISFSPTGTIGASDSFTLANDRGTNYTIATSPAGAIQLNK
jgi:prepilin-type N-terminal cleavage/methylation domain-containing protein